MDDALAQGDELVTDYDSMIAKLIVHASDREECIARSQRALAEYDIEGVTTIVPFHRLMLEDDAFVAGTHTTKYLDEELDQARVAEAQEKWGTEAGGEDGEESETTEREFTVEVNGKRFEVNLEEEGAPAIPTPDTRSSGGSRPSGAGGSSDDDGADADTPEVPEGGESVAVDMQGTVLSVEVGVGDEVAPGDTVAVLEAMKMENDIDAERGGTVSQVLVSEGESVDMGDVLVVLE